METKTNNARVVRGRRIELLVPHNGREIAFAYPSAGPDTYRNVGKRILSQGQRIPTGDETASLLYAAYCSPEVDGKPEFKNVRDLMRKRWLWVFNRNLWTAKGVYVLQDSEAVGRSEPLNVNDLEEMLKDGKEIEGVRFSNDRKVRFAPKETYQLGEQTPKALTKNSFIIASCGEDGAKKLGEVSAKLKLKPYVWCIETEKPEQRVSALVDWDGGRLGFNGGDFDGGRGSHAFGVLE